MFSVPCSYIPFDAHLFQLWPVGAPSSWLPSPLADSSPGQLPASWYENIYIYIYILQIHCVHFLPLPRNQTFLKGALVPSTVSPLPDNPVSRLQPRLELLIPSGQGPLAPAPAARKSRGQGFGFDDFYNVFLCSHQADRKGGSPDMGNMVRQ